MPLSSEFATVPPLKRRAPFFDPHRRAKSQELKREVGQLVETLLSAELAFGIRDNARGKVGARKFATAVEAIACNLLVLEALDPKRDLAVPRGNGVMFASNPQGGETYGRHFLEALDLMTHHDVNLVEVVATGYKFADGASRATTIRGTAAFFALFSEQSAHLGSHQQIAETDVLVLKGVKPATGVSKPIPFAETKRTRDMRAQIVKLNAWLSAAPLFLKVGDMASLNDKYEDLIDPTKRSLRRIFSNGKWVEGGRLFGGFWETMRRKDRFDLLRIGTRSQPDGEPVANVDYGQLFPRLAYMQAFKSVPEGDLYDVFGNRIARAGVKKLFNAMLFAKGPLGAWPKETRHLFPSNIRFREALSAITTKHSAIAPMFGTGIGYRLMFIESTLLVEPLEYLKAMGIIALPLHDSVLVGRSEAEAAKAVLEDRLDQFLLREEKAVVTIDFGGNP